ncbi:unnamed protein product [Candida parapsilosis]
MGTSASTSVKSRCLEADDYGVEDSVNKLEKQQTNSTSSGPSIHEYSGFDARDINQIARTYTNEDTSSATKLRRYLTHMSQVPGVNPAEEIEDERLDPNSEYFEAKFWVKNQRNSYGTANDTDYQPTVTNGLWKYATEALSMLKKEDESKMFDILKDMDALMRPGELTVVLGRPGAGCSTLLKTIAVNTYGFTLAKSDVIYSAETDVHFPHLSVGDTLQFAARMRTPQNRGENVDREKYAEHMADVYMATYEASLNGANIQCWDNATRGLDSATALEFIRALKTSAAVLDTTPLIAIYQCSQDAYDLFDKVVVLYEGYQIFFGRADKAKEFFVNMGWDCPQRQTTADFLTSLSNPSERKPRPGLK